MSIKSKARAVFARTGCNVRQQFTPVFDVPTTLDFGDIADEGTSDRFSRRDHRHGMPATPSSIIQAFDDAGFFYHELCSTSAVSGSPSNGIITRQGAAVNLGEDDADGSGGFGQITINTGVASPNQASGLILAANVTTANFSVNSGTQSLQNLRMFQCSAHVRKLVGTNPPLRIEMGVGGFLFNIGDNANFRINDIVSGIGFVASFDLNAEGHWFGAVFNGGTRTANVDLGVGLDIETPSALVSNQRFTIVRDGTTLGFFINGILSGVLENVEIPTDKVCGFGAFALHPAPRTTQHVLVCDHILVRTMR